MHRLLAELADEINARVDMENSGTVLKSNFEVAADQQCALVDQMFESAVNELKQLRDDIDNTIKHLRDYASDRKRSIREYCDYCEKAKIFHTISSEGLAKVNANFAIRVVGNGKGPDKDS